VPLPLSLMGKFDEEWNEIKKDSTSYDSDYDSDYYSDY
jgi:hypothetical protein